MTPRLAQIRRGDRVFERLYRRQMADRYVLVLLRDPLDAEDPFNGQLEGALSCREAERAISRQLDGRLARAERKPLRQHLRECAECARFGRSQRARRSAWKALASVPLPVSLQSFQGADGVMETTLGRGAGSVALAAAARTLAVLTIGISGIAMLYESLGYGTPDLTAPAPSVQGAPAARRANPSGRPTAVPEQIKAAPAANAPSRLPTRASTPLAGRPTKAHPNAVAAKGATTRAASVSQAIQIRAPARSKPVGHTQTAAANEPARGPTPSAPPQPQAAPQIVPPAPVPSLQLPTVPQLPPAPLPLPPPHLP
jgi:hypothetical protein